MEDRVLRLLIRLRSNALAPRTRHDLRIAPSIGLDDVVLGMRESRIKVVVNRVKDVCYPDVAPLAYGDRIPVPPHPWLVDEANIDA